ncbi:unknown protein [Parachlamydia acanthamoebae UV-7]|uniref:Uncharacterized protein n=3 Tax=Parachlamydiaceae TaxID=92713 RepID=F8L212_PARAV|nr:hypothetical protein [Parachlamydia acanthamoebae]KIA76976.1 hypothetical protein DB43_HB00040 [Parachlamydia acanthamoebae]CCB87329.1 unknown protein [Parachlamydia acanthamoebae UV-7]
MAKPEAIKLIVTVSNKTYVLGILSFNTKKHEFSYHFTYPAKAPIDHYNCDTGLYTARFDHITWHRNNVHIKRRDDVAIERIDLNPGPLFCEKPVVTPLYVESIYFNNNCPCLQEIEHSYGWNSSQTQQILNLEESLGFSVMFILVPSLTKMKDLLLGFQFLDLPEGMNYPPCLVDLCNQAHRTGRIILWSGWDLIILTSPYTCKIKSVIPKELGESYRLPNYKNVPAAVTDLLMQANDLTREGDRLVKVG